MDTKLKEMINETAKMMAKTAQAPDSTTATPGNSYTITAPSPVQIQYGWKCPVCGAVMSPITTTCVNCHGNGVYPYVYPYPWTIQPNWINPVVTCETPQVTLQNTTTNI